MHVYEEVDQPNENFEDETEPTEIEGGNKRPRVDPKFDVNIGREMVAKMVVMHELPLSFVKYFGFRDLMKYCKPLISPLSKDLLKKEIFKLYDVERTTTRKMMGKIESKIAISVDFVTPHNEKSRYMAVTAHFVDNLWALQRRIMRFIHVPFPYTAEMICDELVELLIDWNLDRKLSALTIDSCSINDAMMSMLIAKFTVDSKVMGGRFFHLQCCAQILDLIMKDEMAVIEKDIEKIRDSISFMISTTESVENFENTARRLNVAYTKKLILDSKSMWNSTYLMLSTALEYKDVFLHLKMCDEQCECLPTESEWKMAKAICEHLEVFNELKEMFLETKYMTADLFLLMISDIRLSINKWLKSSDDDIKCRATNMMAKFETYWEVVYGVKAMAVVLDPRYKMRTIELMFLEIYGDDAKDHIKRVHSFCSDFVNEYQQKNKFGADYFRRFVPFFAIKHGKEEEYASYLADNYKRERQLKPELDSYLDNPLEDTKDLDILTWWKAHRCTYPLLSLIARDILAIPLSTAASKSPFSNGNRYLSPHRSRLQPDILEAVTCTQNWFWGQHQGQIPECQIVSGMET